MPPLPWQACRNAVAVALQLGGGLGPGDVRALRLSDLGPAEPSAPAVWPRAGTDRAQVARLPDAAARLRPDLPPDQPQPPLQPQAPHTPTGTPIALPATLQVPANGSAPAHPARLAAWAAQQLQQWLLLRQHLAIPGDWLLPSTRSGKPWRKVGQYQAVRQLLADAGLPADAAGGSFRLRHSFALRQLQLGHAPDTVAQWLGVSDPGVLLRYQRLLPREQDTPD